MFLPKFLHFGGNSLKVINHQIVNITNAFALLSTTMVQLLLRKVYPILI